MPQYQQDPRSSTFYAEHASIVAFQQLVPVERGGETEFYIDMLHHKTLSMVRRLPTVAVHTFQGVEHITTVSYNYFKTTSYWWLLMLYNGFVHPLEILPGTLIRIPDYVEFENNIREAKTVAKGGAGTRTVLI